MTRAGPPRCRSRLSISFRDGRRRDQDRHRRPARRHRSPRSHDAPRRHRDRRRPRAGHREARLARGRLGSPPRRARDASQPARGREAGGRGGAREHRACSKRQDHEAWRPRAAARRLRSKPVSRPRGDVPRIGRGGARSGTRPAGIAVRALKPSPRRHRQGPRRPSGVRIARAPPSGAARRSWPPAPETGDSTREQHGTGSATCPGADDSDLAENQPISCQQYS